jgi:hypothetical protein
MHQRKRRSRLWILSPEQLNRQYNHTEYKYKQADPVDPMHISDPFAFRAIWVFLLQIKIFCQLFQDSHIKNYIPARN